MIARSILAKALTICVCWFPYSHLAQAASIEGVWATDAAVCSKIYVRSGKSISFAKDADLYGSGLVIDGNQIKGKGATCKIKQRRQDGNTVHLVAECSTSIAPETMQLSLRIVDDNKIFRIFPGRPELETPYERCSF